MARRLNTRLVVYLFIFVAVPLAVLLVAFYSDWLAAGDPQVFFDEAKKHMEEEDWTAAWISIRKSLAVGGARDPKIQYTLGRIALRQSPPSVGVALRAFRNAVMGDPTFFDAQRDLAQLYVSVRYWKEANAEIEVLTKLDPSFAPAYVWGAGVELQLAQAEPIQVNRVPHYEAAASRCLAGIERVPQTLELYRLLAMAYEGLDQPEKVDEVLGLAIANNPTEPQVYVLKANRLIFQDRTDEAVELLKQGLEKTDKHAMLYRALGQVAIRNKDIESAKEFFEEAVAAEPENEIGYLRLAGLFRMEGEREKAIEILQKGLEQVPDSLNLKGDQADAYLELRDFEKADALVEEIDKAQPGTAGADYLRGKRAMINRRILQAITYLEQARQKGAMPQSRLLLGRVYLLADELGAAEQELTSLLADHPDLVGARRTLAQVQLRLHRYPDALRNARAMLESLPDDMGIRMVLAQALVGQRRFDEAVKELQIAAGRAPEDPDPLMLMGQIYHGMERLDEAEGAYRKAIALGKDLERVYPRVLMFYWETDQKEKMEALAEQARKVLPEGPVVPGSPEELAAQLKRRIEEDPSRVADLVLLGRLHQATDRLDEAKEAFELVLQKAEPASLEWRQAWQQMYVIHLGADAYEEAARLVERLKEVDADAPELLLATPLIALSEGRLEEATDLLRNVLQTHRLSRGYYLLGQVLAQQRQWDEAVDQLHKALELRPNLLPARLLLGRIHLSQGNYAGALFETGETLKFSPQLVPALEMKAVAQVGGGAWDEAVKTREGIADIVPGHVGNLASLAALYLQRHAPEKAEAVFGRAYKAAPDNAYLVRRFAEFYAQTGKPEKGAALIDEYVSRNSDQPRAHVLRGEFTATTAGVAEAEPHFRVAASMAPEDPWPLILLGDQYSKVMQWDKAAAAYSQALERDPEAVVAKKRLANVYMFQDKLDTAQKVIGEVLEARPDDGQSLVVAGQIASRRGEVDRARELMQKAVDGSPQYGEAKFRLAELYVSSAPMRSLALLNEVDPSDPAYEKAMLMRATINSRRGQMSEAVVDLRRLLAFRPTSFRGRIALASQYITVGEPARAAPVLEQLVRERPDDPRLLVMLGDAFSRQKRYQEALARYEAARSLRPEASRAALAGEARCLVALNRKDEAIKRVRYMMNQFSPEVWPRLALVAVYEMTGELDKAVETIRTGLLRHPEWEAGYVRLSEILGRQKKMDEARQVLASGLGKLPKNVPIRTALSNLSVMSRRWESARTVLEPLAEEFRSKYSSLPEDLPKLRLYIPAISNYSLVLYNLDRIDEAIQWGLMVWDLAPTEVTNANNVAWMLATEKEDFEKALEMIERCMRLVPNHPQVLDTAGWLAFLKGEYQSATDYLVRSVQRQDNPQARYHLGRTYEMRDRPDDARDQYQRAIELGLSGKNKQDAVERLSRLKS